MRHKSSTANRNASPRQQAKVHKVMKEFKDGELKSGPQGRGGKVKSRKQAVAIAMHESGQSRARKQSSAHT